MLLLFIALPEEAKPLIKKYKLKKSASIYQNDRIKLIITGKGPFAACSMVERYGTKKDIFVNIGICGSEQEDIGQLFLAGKLIMDGEVDYPRFGFKTKIQKKALTTILSSKNSYPKDSLVDMEAFGFFKSALSFATREEIAVIKIVSDNKNSSFDKTKVYSLIESNIEAIDNILSSLVKKEKIDLSIFLQKWHFTASEAAILLDLMHNRSQIQTYEKIKHLTSAKQVLISLNKERMLTFE